MALDGITIACLVREMEQKLTGGRVSRIAQTESDELILTVKKGKETSRLMISASPSLPLMYFTGQQKAAPATAPNFCMLLRKYMGNGRILSVTQPGLERIVHIRTDHFDEMGDLAEHDLIVELMGKYSNIIFTDAEGTIIDSIRRVPASISSVREVLPGRPYFIADTTHKFDPLTISEATFVREVATKPLPVAKALYQSLTGISPFMAQETAARAGVDADRPMQALQEAEILHLYHTFSLMMDDVKNGNFSPRIIDQNGVPAEFSALPMTICTDLTQREFSSMSEVLETYYAEKNAATRIHQRSAELRHQVQTVLERDERKYELQRKQLKDTEKRERYRVRGELIQAYGYGLEEGAKELVCSNYYDEGKTVKIPLDPQLTPQENAQHCFEKYNKLKRTYEALSERIRDTEAEIDHLRSVQVGLDIAQSEEDLAQIRTELEEAGYVRRRASRRKGSQRTPASRPLHYRSTDGYDIYVGKNNLQNEELTFRFADGGDIWFHAKGVPGSHVIVKGGSMDMPARVFEEAAALAAMFSSERGAGKVEVDYIPRKFVKKPAGARPGYVIYHTNYSLVAEPALAAGLEQVKDT